MFLPVGELEAESSGELSQVRRAGILIDSDLLSVALDEAERRNEHKIFFERDSFRRKFLSFRVCGRVNVDIRRFQIFKVVFFYQSLRNNALQFQPENRAFYRIAQNFLREIAL